MAFERKKLGIYFSYSESWIGGSYYFMNMISALLLLPDAEQPEIIILSENEASYNKIKSLGYPHLSYLPSRFKYNVAERFINKVSRIILKKNLVDKGYDKQKLPLLFGYYEHMISQKCDRKLYWIPDFQDKYYPQYFSNEVLEMRKNLHRHIAFSATEVVFSSNDSKNDFEKFYPGSVCKKHVIPFAVTLPFFDQSDAEAVKLKHNLSGPYFIVLNQYWQHKNHITVIKAVELLKKRGIEVQVVFTSKEDERTELLKKYVSDNGLRFNCMFLGFLDRSEQLLLIKNAVAVVQPSLFEGWSTVVEDAKSIGKYLILSNLPVHKEQVNEHVVFFDPLNADMLAGLLQATAQSPAKDIDTSYGNNIARFSRSIVSVI